MLKETKMGRFLILIVSLVLVLKIRGSENGTDSLMDSYTPCLYSSFDECTPNCGIRNSTCKSVFDLDVYECQCFYCNYDSKKKKCIGKCDGSDSLCMNRVKTPKKDSDCQCFKCTTKYDAQGNVVCSEKCLSSGLACKPTMYRDATYGPQFTCTCQNPKTTVPDQNFCRYRPSLGRCDGKCPNGLNCVQHEVNLPTMNTAVAAIRCGCDYS